MPEMENLLQFDVQFALLERENRNLKKDSVTLLQNIRKNVPR